MLLPYYRIENISAHNVHVLRFKECILGKNGKWIKFSPTMKITSVRCFGSFKEAYEALKIVNKKAKSKA
jgi:hypothetical protein